MALSDAQKRANTKWNRENQKNLACTVSTAEHTAFKAYAEQHGKTISGMILEYVRGCISFPEQKPSTEQMFVTRDEVLSLMSIRGKDDIIGEVSKIDSDQAKNYLMMVLLLIDKQKELGL